jgi:hypothetical protein
MAPHVVVQPVAHETVAIGVIGRVVVGVIQRVAGAEEVSELLARLDTIGGWIAKFRQVLAIFGLRRKRDHFEVQVVSALFVIVKALKNSNASIALDRCSQCSTATGGHSNLTHRARATLHAAAAGSAHEF